MYEKEGRPYVGRPEYHQQSEAVTVVLSWFCTEDEDIAAAAAAGADSPPSSFWIFSKNRTFCWKLPARRLGLKMISNRKFCKKV